MQITPDYNPTGSLDGVELLILNAQTVLETKSIVVCPGPSLKNHTITLVANATVPGTELTGAVQIETNNDPAGLGSWNPLGGGPIDVSTIDVPAATSRGVLQFNFSNIIFTAIRLRITTVIANGTLSATYQGQR